MTTSELQRERERRLQDLRFKLNMAIRAPERFQDEEMRHGAVDFLKSSIAELEQGEEEQPQEMKNTRRAGRMSLRDRLRTLVAVIVTQNLPAGK